ncbi:MAG: putative drug exporter of the superfamily [Solirubrobacteraceae bacterium]|jgi:RND superfamily putative drug exporter|nr:putative drug exporter of the superfamily [Solirubrobacteraceae bacterium]
MGSLFAFVAGRRAKWLVALIWLAAAIAALAANMPGKFSDAQRNESTSYLPGDAESSKALALTKRLEGGELAPLVVVYHRDGGLTAADRRVIARDRKILNRKRLPKTSPFGRPTFSADGEAALVVAQITSDGEGHTITDPVDAVRKRMRNHGHGLEAKVTGAAGYSADGIKVFEGINGTLLLAAFALVLLLLILIYRSPIFWLVPIAAVVCAEIAAEALGYGLTTRGVTVNTQSSSILSVLVLGAGTDYALLLVARYREELRRHADRHEAMALALRTAGPAIFASGLTVIAALLCLSLAKVNGTSGLGPIGAMGIAVAMLAMLTLLPALLVIVGRWAFFPFIPRYDPAASSEQSGRWRRLGERIARRPRRVWACVVVLLLVLSLGVLDFDDGLTQGNQFRGKVESVEGQKLISRSFPGGANGPTDVVVRDLLRVEGVRTALTAVPGVVSVMPAGANSDTILLKVVLKPEPFSTDAFALIPDLRAAAKRAGGRDTLVGGATAVEADLRDAAGRDTRLIIPIALLVVFLILAGLLRAIVAPLLLIATVIASFAASLGVGAVVFDLVFGFPGSQPSLPLFAFIFLVALGIDYNIFLMARVREETVRYGTREGMLRGLAVTGGVITSAGIVLAGTFAVLGVLPIVFLTQIGFVVAFGVLLDTFVVRSVLVPALVLDVGRRAWWPSRLANDRA